VKIAVTGIGCISALGHNYAEFKSNLMEGLDGVGKITLFDKSKVGRQVAAEVKNFDPTLHFDSRKDLPYLDKYCQFALVSSREAAKSSFLDIKRHSEEIGVCFGTGIGGVGTIESSYRRLFEDKSPRLPPFTLPRLLPSSAASQISIDLGITGPSFGVTSACASSSHAITSAIMLLQTKQAKAVICGGSETPVSYSSIKVWEALRVLSKDKCQPFSANRGGVVLGEGSGTLVLEDYDFAINRGAKILAVISGFGLSSDAYHIVAPSMTGMVAAMQKALDSANLDASEIDYINAHGSGTEQNDSLETAAIKKVFGKRAYSLPISSTKSMHGHILGGAGVLESIACIAAIEDQEIPPTINYSAGDPNCDLDYVPNQSRPAKVNRVISNSFAFGGLNVSLLFSKHNV
jgi:nodulation protein E